MLSFIPEEQWAAFVAPGEQTGVQYITQLTTWATADHEHPLGGCSCGTQEDKISQDQQFQNEM